MKRDDYTLEAAPSLFQVERAPAARDKAAASDIDEERRRAATVVQGMVVPRTEDAQTLLTFRFGMMSSRLNDNLPAGQ